ncbi:MAG: hypothetical protein HY537_06630 [Deltaproteobacteria bacterium]|nr:hypothetical protein [Deltaproteobacteria bacterium]
MKKTNGILFLMGLILCGSLNGEYVDDLAQWTLRFSGARSLRVAMPACFGTASYRYRLPSIAHIQSFRKTLAKMVSDEGPRGLAFAHEDVGNKDHLVDLQTGKAVPARWSDQGLVFCLCDRRFTHTNHCAPGGALPPLGKPFLARRDDLDAVSDQWTDPVTGDTWRFAGPALAWKDAMAACGGGWELPEYPVISHAALRIYNSELGKKIVASDSRVVWSATEFEAHSAMVVYIPRGDASATGKQWLYPALCRLPARE